MTDLLKDYTILSAFGIPLFAVKTQEELEELQALRRWKLKAVKGLELVEVDMSGKLEIYTERLLERLSETEIKKASWLEKAIGVPLLFVCISWLVAKHFVFRIGWRRKITEAEVGIFYECAVEAIEHGREIRIKRLAGIE